MLLIPACSPHVTVLRERIAVNGQPISEAAFDALIAEQQPALEAAKGREGGALSHFEILTALAYRHFQDVQVRGTAGPFLLRQATLLHQIALVPAGDAGVG